MIKKTLLRIFNLYFIIISTILISGIFVSEICINSTVSEYKESVSSKKAEEVSAYATRISNQILVTDYLKSTNDTIDNELDVAAELYGGRILVVNSTLEIIYDSYGRDKYKTALMTEILSTFKGNNVSNVDWKNAKGTLCHGITESNRINGCIMFIYSLDKESESLNNITHTLNVISLAVIIAMLFLGIIISLVITTPLKGMQQKLDKISNGDMEVELDEKGIYEFKKVSESVNGMLTRVRATDKTQQEFVSNVSHELKTPMTSMKVLAETLLMQEGAPEEMYREFLSDINQEIDRENNIINDLLELVKLKDKNIVPNITRCSINEILELVLKRITPIARARNIEIIYESYKEVIMQVDSNRIIMALTNICENAVKYNKDNGRVRVALTSDIRHAYITVEDTGRGIPEESLNHIFDRFYRVDKARDRETGGSGLGLYIVSDIVRLHGGTIKVTSRLGEGTKFVIKLPLTQKSTNLDSVKSN